MSWQPSFKPAVKRGPAAALNAWSHTSDVIAAYPEAAAALRDATVIITGPTAGIGVPTTIALAGICGRVVLAARSGTKAEEVIGQIRARHPEAQATWIPLDLASLASVTRFADRFTQQSSTEGWPPLKQLVLNAGMFAFDYTTSADGHELTFAVNHLAHFHLTTLLLPHLRAAAPARVVVVASDSHQGPLAVTDVTSAAALRRLVCPAQRVRERFSYLDGIRAYGSSKLANVCFAQALHERLHAEGVSACSLHPGTMMATDIARGSRGGHFLMNWLLACVTKDADQGSSTTLVGCLAPAAELAGGYFSHCQPQKKSALVSAAACDALWRFSEDLCDIADTLASTEGPAASAGRGRKSPKRAR